MLDFPFRPRKATWTGSRLFVIVIAASLSVLPYLCELLIQATFFARSHSPNSSAVQQSVDWRYDERKRSSAWRWMSVNSVLFLVFAYDVWQWCPGYMSALQYAELVGAGVLLANALVHGARLAAPRRAPPRSPPRPTACSGTTPSSDVSSEADHSVSLSPARWRSSPPPSPPTPSSPGAPAATGAHLDRVVADEFIADRRSLAEYLRACEERARAEAAGAAWAPLAGGAPRHYQLAALDHESAREEPGEARAPHVWRRLQLDPRRLTQWNFNLRLWLHVTILERLARELDACGAPPLPQHLLPYVQPFADHSYVVQRIKELAAGGCLSAYKWDGGGSAWDERKPTDAELVLHLLSAYLDAQLAPASFSGTHVSSAPAPPPRGPRALAVHRVAARPPHYALALAGETVELARGRNNLLHTLLLLLAAAAQRRPPALQRVHLGPAGLNMLWIIGR